jgi:hypothetical protein
VGRVVLARWLLRAMGTLAVPVGLERLRGDRPARTVRVPAIEAVPQRAIAAPRLAIEDPVTVAARALLDECEQVLS